MLFDARPERSVRARVRQRLAGFDRRQWVREARRARRRARRAARVPVGAMTLQGVQEELFG